MSETDIDLSDIDNIIKLVEVRGMEDTFALLSEKSVKMFNTKTNKNFYTLEAEADVEYMKDCTIARLSHGPMVIIILTNGGMYYKHRGSNENNVTELRVGGVGDIKSIIMTETGLLWTTVNNDWFVAPDLKEELNYSSANVRL